MLKKVGFHNGLIPIGNANVYQGKPVWTDGRVAYGWHYNIQNAIQAENRATAGLWVGAERMPGTGNSFYVLMDENLNFENTPIRGLPEPSYNIYNDYCYPWAICTWNDWSEDPPQQGEMIYDSTNHYHFVGYLIKAEPGKVLTYYDEYDYMLRQYTHYWLCSYDEDGSVTKTDLKPLDDQYGGFYNWYEIYAGEPDPGIASTNITALNTQGGYVTVKTEDPDEPYIHFYASNGVCTEQPFPTQMILSSKAKLMLPSLDLICNGTTYTNDILKLLDGSSSYWWNRGASVNGVHAYNDIIISQYSNDPYGDGYLFKNGTLYDHYSFRDPNTGEGVLIAPVRCWNLAEIPGGQWYIDYNPYE